MSEQPRHPSNANDPDDELRRLLRAADPAGGQAQLDAVARAEMRKLVTDAAGTHGAANTRAGARIGRPAWLVPALAAAVLVTAVGLALRSLPDRPAGDDAVVERGGSPPEPSVPEQSLPQPATPAPTVADVDTVPPSVADEPQVNQPSATPVDPAAADLATVDETATDPAATTVADTPSPPDREPRTLQFVAPRGTRIIWTLDPNYESPIAGHEPRQE